MLKVNSPRDLEELGTSKTEFCNVTKKKGKKSRGRFSTENWPSFQCEDNSKHHLHSLHLHLLHTVFSLVCLTNGKHKHDQYPPGVPFSCGIL